MKIIRAIKVKAINEINLLNQKEEKTYEEQHETEQDHLF